MTIKNVLLIGFVLFCFGYAISAEKDDSQGRNEVLKVGYLTYSMTGVDANDAKVALEIWTDQLAENLGENYIVKAVLFEEPQEMIRAIRKNEIDIITLPSLLYLKIKDEVAIEPKLVPVHGDNPVEEFVLLTHKDAAINNISELKDKNMIIQANRFEESVPFLWLEIESDMRLSNTNRTYFSSIKGEPEVSKTILPVFFKQADACIVNRRAFETMSELNPQIKKNLSILDTSAEFLHSLICIRSSLNKKTKEMIMDVSLKIDKYPKGKQIQTLFKFNQLVPFKEDFVTNLLALLDKHDQLK